MKNLLKMIYDLYDVQKSYQMIFSSLNSKNLVTQAECLDELADFITKYGVNYTTEKELKYVAKMADSSSKFIRENALKFLGETFRHLDDNIWRAMGDLTPKVQSLLE